ncbi:TetR family transcriptional regulator [Leifsonia sp. Root227]|jgi:hypothetical protein|uniref:hypothetical protein n=1 Tax=unclassified Leifsonia TaxID=2663824 RepID=UPI0006F7AE9E|nr:hypothetical protein [Leifsonia sp. Root227]KRC46975.1 TetR family transcriptional regulator [Leifsonia sp. Root227]
MTISHADQHACDRFRAETHLEARPAAAPGYIVHALGREFRVSDEMARIFLRQVERVLETDTSALVVLRHAHGVELLLVRDDNAFSIRQEDAVEATRDAHALTA